MAVHTKRKPVLKSNEYIPIRPVEEGEAARIRAHSAASRPAFWRPCRRASAVAAIASTMAW